MLVPSVTVCVTCREVSRRRAASGVVAALASRDSDALVPQDSAELDPRASRAKDACMSRLPDWVSAAREGHRAGGASMRPKRPGSPYYGKSTASWTHVTRQLLAAQPLAGPSLLEAVLSSWEDIFRSNIGPARIGTDLKPAPQILGNFLHELIPLRLAQGSQDWRREARASEKDLVYIPDDSFSIEIKTSSHPTQIFGNRSFGVDNPGKRTTGKPKAGYYAAVNFGKWTAAGTRPEVLQVRYGWLDDTDWVAQTAETGQASSLPADVDNKQLLIIHP